MTNTANCNCDEGWLLAGELIGDVRAICTRCGTESFAAADGSKITMPEPA